MDSVIVQLNMILMRSGKLCCQVQSFLYGCLGCCRCCEILMFQMCRLKLALSTGSIRSKGPSGQWHWKTPMYVYNLNIRIRILRIKFERFFIIKICRIGVLIRFFISRLPRHPQRYSIRSILGTT